MTPSPDPIQTLRDEIAALTQEQSDAMRQATFLGMTAEEARVFDARSIKIDALIKELAQLKSIQ